MIRYAVLVASICVGSALFSQESPQVFSNNDLTKLQTSAHEGMDLVDLDDGTQLKGVISNLPPLQFTFGKITIPTADIAAITFQKRGMQEKMQVLTREGYLFSCTIPEVMVELSQPNSLRGNFASTASQEINILSINAIIFKKSAGKFTQHTTPVLVITLKNGDTLPANLDGVQIPLSDGWHDETLTANNIVDVTVDGSLYGTVEGENHEERPLDFAMIKDASLKIQIPTTGQNTHIPWNQIASIKRVQITLTKKIEEAIEEAVVPKVSPKKTIKQLASPRSAARATQLQRAPDTSNSLAIALNTVVRGAEGINTSQQENTSLRAALEQLSTRSQNLQERYHELFETNQTTSTELSALRAKYQLEQQESLAHQKTNDLLMDKNQTLQQALAQHTTTRDSEQVRLDSMESDLEAERAQTQELENTLANLNDSHLNKLSELAEQIDLRQQALKQETLRAGELQERFQQAEEARMATLKQKDQELATFSLLYTALMQETATGEDSLQEELQTARAKCQALEAELTRAQRTSDTTKSEIESMTTEAAKSYNLLQGRLEQALKDLETSHNQHRDIEKQLTEAAVTNRNLEEKARKHNALQEHLEQALMDLETSHNQYLDTQKQLTDAVVTNRDLENKIAEHDAFASTQTLKETELAEQIDLRQRSLKEERKRAKKLEASLQQKEEDAAATKQELQSLREEMEEGAKALVAKQLEVETLTSLQASQADELSQQSETLKERNRELEDHYAALASKYRTEKEERKTLQEQLAQLAAKEQEAKQALASMGEEQQGTHERANQLLSENNQLRGESEELKIDLKKKTGDLHQQKAMVSHLTESMNAQNATIKKVEQNYRLLVTKFDKARTAQVSLIQQLSGDGDHRAEVGTSSTPVKVPDFSYQSIHIVAEGENLTSISMKHYNTTQRWADIFEANRDVIADVNNIRVGTALVIPD